MGLDRAGNSPKFQPAFPNRYHIHFAEPVFELHCAIDENVIDASEKLAVFDKAVDYLEICRIGEYKSVLTRDAAIVEHDVILFRPADGVGCIEIQAHLPASAGGFGDCKYCVQGNRNCKC